MAGLADMLALADEQARALGYASVPLSKGLTVVIDYRDPTEREVRFGRRGTWPSSDEISICRRHVEIPPGAQTRRSTKADWNVITYSWKWPPDRCE